MHYDSATNGTDSETTGALVFLLLVLLASVFAAGNLVALALAPSPL